MKSIWNDSDAAAAVARYAPQGVNEDLALAVYSTRLVGSDPTLVLHGGGNSSVKTRIRDVTGEEIDVKWSLAQRFSLLRRKAEAGMTTAEYAVGTLAACAFAAVLLAVVRSGGVKSALASVITTALGTSG